MTAWYELPEAHCQPEPHGGRGPLPVAPSALEALVALAPLHPDNAEVEGDERCALVTLRATGLAVAGAPREVLGWLMVTLEWRAQRATGQLRAAEAYGDVEVLTHARRARDEAEGALVKARAILDGSAP